MPKDEHKLQPEQIAYAFIIDAQQFADLLQSICRGVAMNVKLLGGFIHLPVIVYKDLERVQHLPRILGILDQQRLKHFIAIQLHFPGGHMLK